MRTAFLSVVLLLSGGSGLLFQTLWLRRSGLVFGNTIWSAALILSSFMAGLALGNALAAAGKLPRWRPLRLYAALEVLIAVGGCILVAALPAVGVMLQPILHWLWPHPAALHLLRFGLAFGLLVVPATAMGATLPVLLGDPATRRVDFHRVTAVLYGSNTLGAVVGAISGEAWLVARFGITGTGFIAAGLSLLAAGGALLLARVAGPDSARAAEPAMAATGRTRPESRWLAVSFMTGAIFLALEVIWFRFLQLYITSSPLAFAMMLAVVLAGIAFGSLVSATLARRWAHAPALLSPLLFAAGLCVLLTYLAFPVPVAQGGAVYVASWRPILRLGAALMFPVAFVSGAIFPALVARVDAHRELRTNSAGLTALVNTIGAALGPLVAGFVLLPQLGFQSALLLCAGAYGVAALIAIDRTTWSWRSRRGLISLAFAGSLAGLLVAFPRDRADRHFANARRPYELDGSRLVRRIEGQADTLQLLRRDFLGQPYSYRLLTNGFSMSGTEPQSQRYMRLFAYLPLALRAQARDALLICYGVGVTADAFLQDPEVRHLDIVDIAPEVFALSAEYRPPAHHNPLQDPRVTTWVQDGRFYLQASPQAYDVITGEPPPLKMAGTVNLYTEEFFRAMNHRLKPGGIATFWLPIYQLRVDEVKAILHAFSRAFPHCSLWGAADHEWIMVGQKEPVRGVNEPELGRLWHIAPARADLVRIGVETPAQLAALFIMDARDIQRVAADVAPLTDDFPKRLSDAPPDLAAIRDFATPYMDGAKALQRFTSSAAMASLWPASLRAGTEVMFAVRETRYAAQTTGSNWLGELDLYLRNTTLQVPIFDVLRTDPLRAAIASAAGDANATEEARTARVAAALAERNLPLAIERLEAARANLTNANDAYLLVYLYCLAGRVREAEAFARTRFALQRRDWFSDWLWQKLKAEYGFRPPI